MTTTPIAEPRLQPQTRSAGTRSAFRHYYDRDALLAEARRQARLARGEREFIWRARILPVGVPAGLVLGTAAWLQGEDDEIAPSLARFAVAFSTAVGASWLGAKLEWWFLTASGEGRRID